MMPGSLDVIAWLWIHFIFDTLSCFPMFYISLLHHLVWLCQLLIYHFIYIYIFTYNCICTYIITLIYIHIYISVFLIILCEPLSVGNTDLKKKYEWFWGTWYPFPVFWKGYLWFSKGGELGRVLKFPYSQNQISFKKEERKNSAFFILWLNKSSK